MQKIHFVDIEATRHRTFLREPEIYGEGEDNILDTGYSTLVTITFVDGSVIQQQSPNVRVVYLTDGPGVKSEKTEVNIEGKTDEQ